MARIDPAPYEQYAPIFGPDATLQQQIYSLRPEIAIAHAEYSRATSEARLLPARLVELVRLRIAYHNQCRSCMAIRYADGAEDGVTEALVCELERPEEAPDLTDAERAALHYADLFATNHHSISDETFDRLRANFSEPEIVELMFSAARFVGFGRMAAVLHMVDDLPERFRDESGEKVTPWGEGEVVHLAGAARAT
jgi:AhpD family alkylhydroperoxidase